MMAPAAEPFGGRLGIIAGRGNLPLYVAEAARAAGADPFVVRLAGEADDVFSGFDHGSAPIGDIAGLAALLKRAKVGRVVLSGAVRRRPELSEIRLNLRTLARLPHILRTLIAGGDDAVLRMAIALIEAQGCQVIGVHDIAPDLLARTGALGAVSPDQAALADIARAADAAETLGRLDIGQGAVCVGGRVVALEGPEGTDQMLARVATMRAEGRISLKRRGVLVKLCKPQQDMRADLPAIGPATVENARAAGLAGIAVEAGRALVVERDRVIAAADAAGLFVTGIDCGIKGDGPWQGY